MSRQLSQQEIDAVFQNTQERKRESPAVKFDFRRPDRIPKSQVRAIHLLHDNFVRNLVSSLSAYLRSYLTVNLVSVEQLSYGEFLDGLPSPTCIVSLGLSPYDGNGILELNPTLVFPILEMLLGGSGKSSVSIQRDITEIEQKLLDSLFRIILNDLKEAWKAVAPIEFTIQSVETEPQFLRVLAPTEAVVAVGIEIRIGDNVVIEGATNIGRHTVIEDDCFVGPRVTLAGGCRVGRGSLLGVGSCISNNCSVSEDCIIGPGTVVVADTQPRQVYVGNPARLTGRDSFDTVGVQSDQAVTASYSQGEDTRFC